MFTLEQIDDVHARLGRASTFAEYLKALRQLGVKRFDSYLVDGHSEYFGDGQKLVSAPVHEILSVVRTVDRDKCLEHLGRHERGETTYLEMSKGLAESGIAKWTADTQQMTMAYCDSSGWEIQIEQIR